MSLILDEIVMMFCFLVPTVARLFFLFESSALEGLQLSPVQRAILIGIGLQCKTVDNLASELDLEGKQLLGKFRDLMRQFVSSVARVKGDAIKSSLIKDQGKDGENVRPLQPLSKEMQDAAKEAFLADSDLSQFKVKGSDEVWSTALSQSKGKVSMLSVKTGEKRPGDSNLDSSLSKPKKKKFKKNKK